MRLKISTGKSRTEKYWAQEEVGWEELAKTLTTPKVTDETPEEYAAMSRDEQGRCKDVGGFVGGILSQGQRRASAVVARSLITLDLDYAPAAEQLWQEACEALRGTALAVYSTHSHTAAAPRLRLVVPLGQMVAPKDYEPLARAVAARVGIEYMDSTTYQAERLFYWPSVSRGGEFFGKWRGGFMLDPRQVMAETYGNAENAADPARWPKAKREGALTAGRYGADAQRLEDPRGKPGIVGLFCRALSVEEVLDRYLADYYTKTRQRGRYTYAYGHTQGGAMVYDDGLHLYSRHDTDPAGGGHCQNAFDLCRLHLFGHLDAGAAAASAEQEPSYQACARWAESLPEVRELRAREEAAQVRELAEMAADAVLSQRAAKKDESDRSDADWAPELARDKKGAVKQTMENVLAAWALDPGLRGQAWTNEHDGYTYTGAGLPWDGKPHVWSDTDDAYLHERMERRWGLTCARKIDEGRVIAAHQLRRHPLRQWLTSLKAEPDAEALDTFLVRYLGAEDNALTRAMTRKHLCAAVARVMQPGVKHDECLVLCGPQGIGKSSAVRELCPDERYFMDSLQGLDKDAMEQLRGAWLIELGELAAMRRADVEQIKSFISRQVDTFRAAYGRNAVPRPRQCVFFATTNDAAFLKDATGNRRFWVVPCGIGPRRPWTEIAAERETLWATALHLWKAGEALYLDAPELAAAAEERAGEYSDTDDERIGGMLDAFLEFPLPGYEWPAMGIDSRREWYASPRSDDGLSGYQRRERMCVMEFVVEYLGKSRTDRDYRSLSMAVARLMNAKEGWERVSSSKHAKALYGIQKAWVRDEKDDL